MVRAFGVARLRVGSRRACAVFAALGVLVAGVVTSDVAAGRTAALTSSSQSVTQVSRKIGYWMLRRDGVVYGFGSARGGSADMSNAMSITPKRDGSGYWVVDALGAVRSFGSASLWSGAPARRPGEIGRFQ